MHVAKKPFKVDMYLFGKHLLTCIAIYYFNTTKLFDTEAKKVGLPLREQVTQYEYEVRIWDLSSTRPCEFILFSIHDQPGYLNLGQQ